MTVTYTASISSVFPFAALVGQEQLKLALILSAINPRTGGLLIQGEKGTAKSTAVRGLAELLPRIQTVRGCPFTCEPDGPASDCPFCAAQSDRSIEERPTALRTLPLNSTEDRLLGGIDLEATLRAGRPTLQPGILAAVHRGILYVDEVNLLDDHLVDVVLDASASGENRIEREGLSFRHAARFQLVATMNPEEGQLRPQLLDRFGLCVRLAGIPALHERMLLMERREAFDADPEAFRDRFAAETLTLSRRIAASRVLLAEVVLAAPQRTRIAELALENAAAGHRADLVLAETARALAAWHGRTTVCDEDLDLAATLALLHRRREREERPRPDRRAEPPQEPPPPPAPEEQRRDSPPESAASMAEAAEMEPAGSAGPAAAAPAESSSERVFDLGEPFQVRRIEATRDRLLRRGSGRRSRTRTAEKQGRYVRAVPDESPRDLALDATLRAAAPHQASRPRTSAVAITVQPQDYRRKVRERRIGHFIVFVVDASGSMGARGRMTASKSAVLSLLLDAYQKRDRVAMVSFRGANATVNVPPTSSVELAARHLRDLPVGGRTPLAAGLARSCAMVDTVLRRTPTARPIVVLVTDGKANQPLDAGARPVEEALAMARRWARDPRVLFLVVDTEPPGLIRFGVARQLADALSGHYYPMTELRADSLLQAVKRSL